MTIIYQRSVIIYKVNRKLQLRPYKSERLHPLIDTAQSDFPRKGDYFDDNNENDNCDGFHGRIDSERRIDNTRRENMARSPRVSPGEARLFRPPSRQVIKTTILGRRRCRYNGGIARFVVKSPSCRNERARAREIASYRRYVSRRWSFPRKKIFFSNGSVCRNITAAKLNNELRRPVAWTNNEIVIVFTRDRRSGNFYERTLNSWILARS